ncbi:efflux RND transporter periplasmic adaptor subunit [Leeuwenhoekiella parthenopeia]|uniref:Efflux RND transporter periplasmic adaptor subunit n=1 Tax=Leeuwenhoekiella parthenopeia TaxID=2890320 RepID=A0ABS8GUW5_9FLAO|nr:efflux RND transporter periplasmic adaptor subunit [Leeuwenhoekiella parthenopeia]MCC4213445.1 efflux RND transporter periplasmic adaptor subunit [Leeuwenhoekiella parthenopeia]
MKKSVTIIILVVIGLVFVGSLYYFYQKNQEDPVVYKTEKPSRQTIIKKTVATGSIVPNEEILIKPNISGIIAEIYVEAGQIVKQGDMIARIDVVPNVSSLVSAKNNIQSARNQLETAKLAYENQKSIFSRQSSLYERGVISANEFDINKREYDRAVQEWRQQQVSLNSAVQNYDIVRTGTTAGLGNAATTQVKATIDGMVLEIPVKEGNQVIEANNFNDGTTIAALANVNDMIFEGKVDESEVGKITEGLPLKITVGAIEDKSFDATLDYIAPKGIAENGAIQFEIKGTLAKVDSTFIRAGLSANASIILEEATDVLAVKEALIQYDTKTQQPFVEVAVGDQQFERRDVKLGVSDGIYVEILEGVKPEDEIKVWNATVPVQSF